MTNVRDAKWNNIDFDVTRCGPWNCEGPYHKGRVDVFVRVLAHERIFVHVAVYGYFTFTLLFTCSLHLSVSSYSPRHRNCLFSPVGSVVRPVIIFHPLFVRLFRRLSCCRRPYRFSSPVPSSVLSCRRPLSVSPRNHTHQITP